MRRSNGFLIAAAGFALLTCGDAVIKSMAGLWPVPAIAALRFTLAIPLLAGIVFLNQGAAGFVVQRRWVQVGRGLMLATSSLLFFLSLFVMPLAAATSIVFVSPVITALLSAVLLKEPMRRGAWLSIALALAGVAMVLRPNLAELGLVASLPLGAALCFSTMIILNRMAAGTGSAMALQLAMVSIAAPAVLLFAILGHWWGVAGMAISWPENSVILRCAVVAISASLSHWLIFQGTMRTTAADAAQAVYVQLVVALALDAIVFRHFPDALAIGGAALIISAGLSMWLGQRRTSSIGESIS